MPRQTKSLKADLLNPTTSLSGDQRPTVYRGVNAVLRGPSNDPYFECYSGDLDLDENYNLATYGLITGTVSCAAGETAVSGSGTAFKSELHIGQLLLAGIEVFAIKEIVSDTSFIADRPPETAVSVAAGYRLPQLSEMMKKRAVQLTGNPVRFPKGHIISAGSGELHINGSPLAGTSLVASKSPQVAIYRPATNDYVIRPLGFASVPPKPTIDVVAGGVKGMTDGDKHSFMFSYWAGSPEGTGGYSDPCDVIKVDSGSAVIAINVGGGKTRFRFDMTASLVGMPTNAKGFIAWSNQGGRKTTSVVSGGGATTTTSPNDTLYENGPWFKIAKFKVASQTFAVGDVHTGTDIIDLPNHPFETGDLVYLSSGTTAISLTALGSPIVNTTPAYVIKVDKDHIKIAASLANAIAGTNDDITGAGAGTHTIQYLSQGKYYYTEFLDSEVLEEVSGNNNKPPSCEFIAKVEGKPLYISCFGQRTNTDSIEGGNPGPSVVVSKFANPDGSPYEWAASVANGADIIGWFEGVGRWFLMTPGSLEFIVSTGLLGQSFSGGQQLELPIISRPYWKTGAANRYSIVIADDTLYGRSGGKFFQSVGNGDENVRKYDFGVVVDDITRGWYDGHVLGGNDPKNTQIVFIYSASHKNSDGYWCSTFLPFSIARNAWLPEIVLSRSDRDMIVSGVATVDEKLEFLAGGRVSGGTFQTRTYRFAAGQATATPIDYYVVWQPSDDGLENVSKQLHSVRLTGRGRDQKVQIHGARPGGPISISDMENGTNPLGEIAFDNTADITRELPKKFRKKNLALYAARISGTWPGTGDKDRIDEVVLEVSAHGRPR